MIGIDEVGRGPLAGPVVVAGVRIRRNRAPHTFFRGIRDSKRLSPNARSGWFLYLTRHPDIDWAVARVWPRVIDRINISQAANLAARRVYMRLTPQVPAPALLDGGLRLPRHIPHQTIIRGDEQIPLIAAASIIAKVTRDRIMARLHTKYPNYGFDAHKGYGTELHRKRLAAFGYSNIHRKSFRFRVANTR